MYSFQSKEPPESTMPPADVEAIVVEQSAEINNLRTLTAECKEQIAQQQVELEALKQQVLECMHGVHL